MIVHLNMVDYNVSETRQYDFHSFWFMKGISEVDDVMYNTVGCLIGWLMVKGARFMFKSYNTIHG